MDHLYTALQDWFITFDYFLRYCGDILKLENCERVIIHVPGFFLDLLNMKNAYLLPLHGTSIFFRQKHQITILVEATDAYTSEIDRFMKFIGYLVFVFLVLQFPFRSWLKCF